MVIIFGLRYHLKWKTSDNQGGCRIVIHKQDFAIHLKRRQPFALLLVIQDSVCEELPKVRSRGVGVGDGVGYS